MHNIHATGVVLGDRGVVIGGASGSGKSLLALSLMHRVRSSGRFAQLIADDQLYVAVAGSRLIASAPKPIAGLIEVRGLGPVSVPHQASAVVDLFVRLTPAENVERLPEPSVETILGVDVPRLVAPLRNVSAAVTMVLERLDLPII